MIGYSSRKRCHKLQYCRIIHFWEIIKKILGSFLYTRQCNLMLLRVITDVPMHFLVFPLKLPATVGSVRYSQLMDTYIANSKAQQSVRLFHEWINTAQNTKCNIHKRIIQYQLYSWYSSLVEQYHTAYTMYMYSRPTWLNMKKWCTSTWKLMKQWSAVHVFWRCCWLLCAHHVCTLDLTTIISQKWMILLLLRASGVVPNCYFLLVGLTLWQRFLLG